MVHLPEHLRDNALYTLGRVHALGARAESRTKGTHMVLTHDDQVLVVEALDLYAKQLREAIETGESAVVVPVFSYSKEDEE